MPPNLTPGVVVEEIPLLAPSVAEVATAIPAFIGYTALGRAGRVEIAQVSSLLEFEERFGGAAPTAFTAAEDGTVRNGRGARPPEQPLWYALNLYFRNGGGRCYVVSVDAYGSDLKRERFEAGIEALAAEDEPTLVVIPGAEALQPADYAAVCQQALGLCAREALRDRFAILDVKSGNVEQFRNDIGTANLMYGAAYHPYLQTVLNHVYDETQIKVGEGDAAPTLDKLKDTKTALYNDVKRALAEQRVVLPPSAAMAGVYARVNRERGVWKAPANVSVASVIGPTAQVTHEQQEGLNVDPVSGKSINAIRAFPGKGTLVWGARTLAGNDNEWRYVPVRRLFITIEESAKKASAFAVFEPNDATTWLKVKGMLESYLYGLWEQGALQGSKPDGAYFVNVGLGKTMTSQDVLEGRMIVEIGIAAVRPAEFVILRFSHKLAEA